MPHQSYQLMLLLPAALLYSRRKMANGKISSHTQGVSWPIGLTAREVEVLRLVAEGLTDPQIGERLFVSRNTVNSHLRGVYGKLGVNTRTAAARLAAEHGLA